MAAFASVTTLMKGYDWMRLFEKTAFYILLIQETIFDVAPFIAILMLSLFMFGMPMIILDLLNSEPDAVIIDELTGSVLFNLMMN